MKKMIVIATVTVSIILVFLGVYLYYAYIYTPENILREARKESEVTEEHYILCRRARVTGFNWLVGIIEELSPTEAFVISNYRPSGTFPWSGITFVDGNDNKRYFAIAEDVEGNSDVQFRLIKIDDKSAEP